MRTQSAVIFYLFFFFNLSSDSFSQQDSVNINSSFVPYVEAKKAISHIVRYTGISPNFIIVRDDVANARAFVKEGKRYIAYNSDFIRQLRKETKTDWAAVSVLAHEIGHHLSGHTLNSKAKGGNLGDELVADKFSGFILYKMGATLEEAQAAMEKAGADYAMAKHPPKSIRLEAITQGWVEAKELENTRVYQHFDEALPLDSTSIFVYECRFTDDDNLYFIDGKDQIIWHDNYGKPIIIGYKTPSESKNYRWMYNCENFYYGVDGQGNIWNETSHGALFIVGTVKEIDD